MDIYDWMERTASTAPLDAAAEGKGLLLQHATTRLAPTAGCDQADVVVGTSSTGLPREHGALLAGGAYIAGGMESKDGGLLAVELCAASAAAPDERLRVEVSLRVVAGDDDGLKLELRSGAVRLERRRAEGEAGTDSINPVADVSGLNKGDAAADRALAHSVEWTVVSGGGVVLQRETKGAMRVRGDAAQADAVDVLSGVDASEAIALPGGAWIAFGPSTVTLAARAGERLVVARREYGLVGAAPRLERAVLIEMAGDA